MSNLSVFQRSTGYMYAHTSIQQFHPAIRANDSNSYFPDVRWLVRYIGRSVVHCLPIHDDIFDIVPVAESIGYIIHLTIV